MDIILFFGVGGLALYVAFSLLATIIKVFVNMWRER